MKKISIIMAYHNRKAQLIQTLQSIQKSKQKDIEIIIVDDCSFDDQRIMDIPGMFNFDIKVIEVNANSKWWINPCITFNIGFKKAQGNIIVIQSPECLHIGDVLSYVAKNVNEGTYICFSCLAASENSSIDPNNLGADIFKQRSTRNYIWYTHPTFRSWAPHFTSTITRKNLLDKLGGFDERYANGYDFDDMEFYERIHRSDLKINIPDPTIYPFVIHQYHSGTNTQGNEEWKGKEEINRNLYYNITLNEKGCKVN